MQRLWLFSPTDADTQPVTRLFRRVFTLDSEPTEATLRVFAEAYGHYWVNGSYLGRGPAYHHPDRRPLDTFNIRGKLHQGLNVLAVLVHDPGISRHNGVRIGEPGLTVELNVRTEQGNAITLQPDDTWKATDKTGFRADVPRRSWAIGHVEIFDTANAPLGWTGIDFDDSTWPSAQVLPTAPTTEWVDRPVPPLRYAFEPPVAVTSFAATNSEVEDVTAKDNVAALGKQLFHLAWTQPSADLKLNDFSERNGSFAVRGLTPEQGAVVCLDLGQLYVGQLVFTAEAESGGTIDLGWGETLENDRPWVNRKGVSYVDRIVTAGGAINWQPIAYTGGRYVMVALRGFTGTVHFNRLGMLTSQPNLQWPGHFLCNDDRLNDIYDLCRRTQDVGTQEGLLDCPTREQSPYIGDGHPVARWIAELTGDVRHWKNLIDEQFRRTSPDGLVRMSIFTGRNDTLIDYCLLAVIGLRDYVRFTDDTSAAQPWMTQCRDIIAWFDNHRTARGLCDTNWQPTKNSAGWEHLYDPAMPVFTDDDALNLFIDHPGMGWHNQGEAGIDRRGVSTALNALLVITKRAFAELEDLVGDAAKATDLRDDADHLARLLRESTFDAGQGWFRDGMLNGQPLEQVSEQSNTWAVAAGAVDDDTARKLFTSLLNSDSDQIARNGPYFFTYLLPEMTRLGLHQLATETVRRRWGKMLDGGASCLWETFAGDEQDSWCHPWSGVPVHYLPSHLAGLPSIIAGDTAEIRPRTDVLTHAEATLVNRLGPMSIRWSTEDGRTRISGLLPQGVPGRLILPSGEQLDVSGAWTHEV